MDGAINRFHSELCGVKSAYWTWCNKVSTRPVSLESIVRDAGKVMDGKILELLLWKFMNGEAANLRHTPNLLSWTYHKLAEDLLGNRRHRSFMEDYVRPMHRLLEMYNW